MSEFAVLLRQPMSPNFPTANSWESTVSSPRKDEKPISVHCSITSQDGEVILREIVDSVILDNGNTYFEVTFRIDAKTGRTKSVYEWIEHGGKDARNPATVYQEVFGL